MPRNYAGHEIATAVLDHERSRDPEFRVRRAIHQLATMPGMKVEALLRLLVEEPLEPEHRERLVAALNDLKARVDVLIDSVIATNDER